MTRFALALLVAALVAACSPPLVLHELRGETMGTTYSIKLVGPSDPELAGEVQAEVDELLSEVNDRFSTWIPTSLVSRFNTHQSVEIFVIDAYFKTVLERALQIAEWSGGAYDPTAMPLVRLYGFGPGREQHTPSDAELQAARALVGWRGLHLEDNYELRKDVRGLELDFSSIAKGWGVDRVSRRLSDRGYPNHFVEIGGEVRCAGEKPGGQAWRVGIDNADRGGSRPIREIVELRDRSLATSGDYRIYYESEGKRVHHVLDARTGINAPNGVIQVAVLADDCMLADGLATALMIVGPEQAREILARPELAGVEVSFLVRDASGAVETIRLP